MRRPRRHATALRVSRGVHGVRCVVDRVLDHGEVRARVTTAVQRVREGFAFVGLAEQWNRSLQLFSTTFGVELLPRTDLAVWRGGPRSEARAWVEALYAAMRFDDDAVYEAAAARFGELEREVLR